MKKKDPKKDQKKKPRVNKELEGFDIEIDAFGESHICEIQVAGSDVFDFNEFEVRDGPFPVSFTLTFRRTSSRP